MKKSGRTLKREGWIIEGIYLILILVRDCMLVHCILVTLYIKGKVIDIKKAMAFTGNRSKSSIGISPFKVKRLFSG